MEKRDRSDVCLHAGGALMRWLGIKTVRLESLSLPGDHKKRTASPHVIALAASIKANANAPINPPVVWWFDSDTKKKPRRVCAGGDRVAALALNGAAALEVNAFEGTEADFLRIRAHENAHRRHDDRDAWLRSLVEASAPDETTAVKLSVDSAQPVLPAQEGAEAGAISHWANSDGNPLCGADNLPGECTVGERVDAPVTCATCLLCMDEAGVERNKLLRSEKPKSAQTLKSEVRKKVAAEVGASPAAVKQAEYRDRLKKGEVAKRTAHNDDGPAMSDAAMKLVADIAGIALALQHQQAAITRLYERNPTLAMRFNAGGVIEMLKGAAGALRFATPHAACCYCLDAPTEDCHACKNDRWLTKAQLRDAPEELRKRVE